MSLINDLHALGFFTPTYPRLWDLYSVKELETALQKAKDLEAQQQTAAEKARLARISSLEKELAQLKQEVKQ